MQSHYYKASDPGEAFEKASKDPQTWNFEFATLEAFKTMTTAIRDGSAVILPMGVDPLYACSRGDFRVATKMEGFGIAVVSIKGQTRRGVRPARRDTTETDDRTRQWNGEGGGGRRGVREANFRCSLTR